MNYIELINRFWEKDIEHHFSDKEIALYFYLLKTSNSIAWKNPFGLSNAMTIAKFRWGKTSFDTAKNNLKKAGLINFKAGEGRGNVYRYELKGDDTDTLSDAFSDIFSNAIPVSKSDTSIKRNKTKPNNSLSESTVSSKRFTTPSIDEIRMFFASHQLTETQTEQYAQAFYNFYESKNWMVGRNKMTNWKAAATKSLQWNHNKTKGANSYEFQTDTHRNNASDNRKSEIMQRAARAIATVDKQGT